ncbi:cysteine--tRNA ligase [Tunicatimonas pelagia]|uniref:cysteine--tRNA ligase n=1 Tax=Tunicatimonas pelagia TaxID=931531 RepID=UPI0026652701|nr:cysteine--tRNA ligase [Tunicatimonas pelagia]WKN40885.1 cysteine--tRNA ligase [Tunicatimonas pelagia]
MDQALYIKYPLSVVNSLTRKKELFKPINPPLVGMYLCGPTVYSDPHLGNIRSAVNFDIIFRYMSHLGYKVRYVRNITDVGHLEDDVEGTGEDKISKKARLEKVEPMEIVQLYTYRYHDALSSLNVLPPSIEPSATGHIVEQIEIIQSILEHGYAYEENGSIYFDLGKYTQEQEYGKLSGKVLEDLQSGSRQTEGLDEKRNPHDFALWKKANPEHIMRWNSPWGEGFPGWHLECTAMSTKYLGETFDIHGGGLDLQFPHHEAEVAQCYGAFHSHPANYWIHHNLITIDGQKMSKSKGNFITLEQLFTGGHSLLAQAYSPTTIRFFILQAHYRSPIDFSNDALQAAEKGLTRLLNAQETLGKLNHQPGSVDEKLDKEINQLCEQCYQEMSDDFNTAKLIAVLFDLGSKINGFYHQQLDLTTISAETFQRLKQTFQTFISEILGIQAEVSDDTQQKEGLIELLISIRNQARANKDFATSDQIRDQLKELGVQLKDEKSGNTTYSLTN